MEGNPSISVSNYSFCDQNTLKISLQIQLNQDTQGRGVQQGICPQPSIGRGHFDERSCPPAGSQNSFHPRSNVMPLQKDFEQRIPITSNGFDGKDLELRLHFVENQNDFTVNEPSSDVSRDSSQRLYFAHQRKQEANRYSYGTGYERSHSWRSRSAEHRDWRSRSAEHRRDCENITNHVFNSHKNGNHRRHSYSKVDNFPGSHEDFNPRSGFTHYGNHHLGEEPSSLPRKSYNQERHNQRDDSNNRSFFCTICGRQFSYRNQLFQHQSHDTPCREHFSPEESVFCHKCKSHFKMSDRIEHARNCKSKKSLPENDFGESSSQISTPTPDQEYHAKERLFCNHCGLCFIHEVDLRHQKCHKGKMSSLSVGGEDNHRKDYSRSRKPSVSGCEESRATSPRIFHLDDESDNLADSEEKPLEPIVDCHKKSDYCHQALPRKGNDYELRPVTSVTISDQKESKETDVNENSSNSGMVNKVAFKSPASGEVKKSTSKTPGSGMVKKLASKSLASGKVKKLASKNSAFGTVKVLALKSQASGKVEKLTSKSQASGKVTSKGQASGKVKELAVEREPSEELKKEAFRKVGKLTSKSQASGKAGKLTSKGQASGKVKELAVKWKPSEKVKELAVKREPFEKVTELAVKRKPSENVQDLAVKRKPSEKVKELAVKREPFEKVTELGVRRKPSEKVKELAVKREPSEKVTELAVKKEPSKKVKELAVKRKPSEKVQELAVKMEPSEKVKELSVKKEPFEKVTELAVRRKPSEKVKELAVKREPSEKVAELAVKRKPSEKVQELAVKMEPSEKVTELAVKKEPSKKVKELAVKREASGKVKKSAEKRKQIRNSSVESSIDTENMSEKQVSYQSKKVRFQIPLEEKKSMDDLSGVVEQEVVSDASTDIQIVYVVENSSLGSSEGFEMKLERQGSSQDKRKESKSQITPKEKKSMDDPCIVEQGIVGDASTDIQVVDVVENSALGSSKDFEIKSKRQGSSQDKRKVSKSQITPREKKSMDNPRGVVEQGIVGDASADIQVVDVVENSALGSSKDFEMKSERQASPKRKRKTVNLSRKERLLRKRRMEDLGVVEQDIVGDASTDIQVVDSVRKKRLSKKQSMRKRYKMWCLENPGVVKIDTAGNASTDIQVVDGVENSALGSSKDFEMKSERPLQACLVKKEINVESVHLEQYASENYSECSMREESALTNKVIGKVSTEHASQEIHPSGLIKEVATYENSLTHRVTQECQELSVKEEIDIDEIPFENHMSEKFEHFGFRIKKEPFSNYPQDIKQEPEAL